MLAQQNSPTQLNNIADILCSAKAKYLIGEYQEAVIEYNLAIQFAPNVAISFSCRGDAYLKLGEVDKAMADYDRSIELDPNIALNYYRRGNLYYSVKNHVRALTEYTRTIELDPSFGLAYIGRGHANRELYGEREGLSDWQAAAKLFQEQGNLEQYQYVKDLIELVSSIDSLSGML